MSFYSASMGMAVRLATETKPEPAKPKYKIIASSKLIPGSGDPIENGAVVVEDDTIIWVGKRNEVPEEYLKASHKLYAVPYLMPGLWDVHVHIAAAPADALSRSEAIFPEPVGAGARLTRMLWEALQRGYTSVRDVAGFGCEVSRAVTEGTIIGPHIYSGGAGLSQLAGHGDEFSSSVGDMLLNSGVTNPHSGYWGMGQTVICDGPEECRKAVRMQIRRGAKCIKIFASGGVLSTDDNVQYAQFSPAELDVIIEECKRFHLSAAAHVHGKEGIMAAINAGVTSLEHVSFADQECIDLIKEKGILYVATRTIIWNLLKAGEGAGIPPKSWKKLNEVASSHLEAYKLAIKDGVTIALGTDTMPGANMAQELELAVDAGMTNMQAIEAATANGPLAVKGQVGKTGQLKVGYEADILGVMEDPTEDVKILQDKEQIRWVWKSGKLFKGPGVGPWGEDDTFKVE